MRLTKTPHERDNSLKYGAQYFRTLRGFIPKLLTALQFTNCTGREDAKFLAVFPSATSPIAAVAKQLDTKQECPHKDLEGNNYWLN